MQNPSYKDGNYVCRSVITERLYIDVKQDKKKKKKAITSNYSHHSPLLRYTTGKGGGEMRNRLTDLLTVS